MRLAKLALAFGILLAAATATDAQDNVATDKTWLKTVEQIDTEFERVWADEEVLPAAPASDGEFLRRVYLDIIGRIPAVSEVREFQASRTPSVIRRRKLVEELLDRPAFIRHLTISLRNSLIPEATEQANLRFLIPGFEAWLWQRLAERTPYNELAHEIITTEFGNTGNAVTDASRPDAFFAAREFKPENLATATSRAFLGVRLDCAQCHDHPFDKWTQEQFWNMAAFYAGFDQQNANPALAMMSAAPAEDANRTIAIPGTDRTVPAVFLTGTQPDWQTQKSTTRQVLADWIVDKQNPWFAKMAVNRLWAQFFGRGLVDPIDDFSEDNPSAVPKVLDLLANDFRVHGYRLERTIKIITATRAYQLGSRAPTGDQDAPELFVRSALRGLTPEQFFDSLAEATGYYQPYRSDNPFVIQQDTPRSRFLNLFRASGRSSHERQTTVLQALAMMNGIFVSDATSIQESVTMKAVTLFPGMSTEQKIETLYFATLSRKPTSVELERATQHLTSLPDADSYVGYADIFWVLLNSSEFLLNH